MDFIGVFPTEKRDRVKPVQMGGFASLSISFQSELVSGVLDTGRNSFALKLGRSGIRQLPTPFALAAWEMVLGSLGNISSL